MRQNLRTVTTDIGAIEANLILPSRCIVSVKDNSEPANTITLDSEICSAGEKDQGGVQSQQAMYAALRYLIGNKKDASGKYITETFSIADTSNIGIFAFSHPGFLANTTLANWGDHLDSVSYTVMRRENPTQPLFASVELGDVQAGMAVIQTIALLMTIITMMVPFL